VVTTLAASYVRREAHIRRRGGNNLCCMLCEMRGTHKETWWKQLVLHVMWEESHTQGDVVETTCAACYVRWEAHTRRRGGNNSCCKLCKKRGTHKETWWKQPVLHVMWEEGHTQGDVVVTTLAASYVRREAHIRRRGGNISCCMLCKKIGTHKETWW